MTNRIAIFANGWSDDYILTVMGGVQKSCQERQLDAHLFVNYASVSEAAEENLGEMNIFRLPPLNQYDGAIIFSNTFNTEEEEQCLRESVLREGIPLVCLEREIQGVDFIGTENYSGIYELTLHMIDVHGAKNIMFVAGPKDNEESNTRMQAVRDAMSSRGLELEDDNILYGMFSHYEATYAMQAWLGTNQELPDAIICANDVMAMAICSLLKDHQIAVPGQVAVTGYDNLESGQNFSPSITSIGRDWRKLGELAVEQICKKIEGCETAPRRMMQSKFIRNCSCGCMEQKDETGDSNPYAAQYNRKMNNMVFNNHFRDIYKQLRKVQTEDEFHGLLSSILRVNHDFEGSNFAICLDGNFFPSIEDDSLLRTKGYNPIVDRILYFKSQYPWDRDRLPLEALFPFQNVTEEERHITLFTPLHIDGICLGFAVFDNNLSVLKDYGLYTWSRYMNQYLDSIRQNLRLGSLNRRLVALSITDGLTGLYNRLGYEKLAIPFLENCRLDGNNGVMMIADINKMKSINDNYGHLQGDLAICAVATAIKRALPEEWISVRYGGDEFLMVGKCQEQQQVEQLKQRLEICLQEIIMEQNLQFPLSVSFGAVWIEMGDNISMEECFKKADESMYAMKKQRK